MDHVNRHTIKRACRIIGFAVFWVTVEANAASVITEARKADKLYEEKKFDEALEYYDQVLNANPDDPRIQYNRAATLYRKGDFDTARESFLRSLSSGDERLEADSMYNAGNSNFRKAEKQEGQEIEGAIEEFNETLEYYKRAMEIDPEDLAPKYNYEYTLKKMSELEKQQEQQQQQENQDKNEDQDKQEDQQNQQQQDQDQNKDQQQEQKQDQPEQEKNKDQQDREQNKDQQEDQQDKEEDQEEQQEEPQPNAGQMSEEQAEMLLRSQSEEEGRMRQAQKEERKGQKARVLRDW